MQDDNAPVETTDDCRAIRRTRGCPYFSDWLAMWLAGRPDTEPFRASIEIALTRISTSWASMSSIMVRALSEVTLSIIAR